jgi:hypothetical protein
MRIMGPVVFAVALVMCAPARAQECAHGPNEEAAQQVRRQAALTAQRMINTAEAQSMGDAGKYVPLQDLEFGPAGTLEAQIDKAAGFQAEFTTDGERYSLILKDTRDPCSFVFATNENGVIFHGYPIDHGVQPVVKTTPQR